MKAAAWKSLVIRAVDSCKDGDCKSLELLSIVLEEHDLAKQLLRDKGYGWTGLSLVKTVETLVPSCE